MSTSIRTLALVLSGAALVAALEVSIRGTVTRTGGGAIRGATVSLAGVPGVSTTTDADGRFALASGAPSVGGATARSSIGDLVLCDGRLRLPADLGIVDGRVEIVSAQGKRSLSLDLSHLDASRELVRLGTVPPGSSFLRVQANGRLLIRRIVQIDEKTWILGPREIPPPRSNSARATTLSFADTLVVEKEGFVQARHPVESRTALDVAIAMDSLGSASFRNIYTEILGKPPLEVDTKVRKLADRMFHGNPDTEALYYEYGADKAYFVDVNNNDIRSEGQSYAMTIAVQLGYKTEFDKLWRYAKSCMRQPNGLFAWQMTPGTCSAISTGTAPDGEEYFATALVFASRRWGDSTGIDYKADALDLLNAIATRNIFSTNPPLVRFVANQSVGDPSYVLPLFYQEWALFDPAHASLWNGAVAYARTYFKNTVHPTTGLAPYRSSLDGTPLAGTLGNYNSDSWRVPMNIMADWAANKADPWQTQFAERNAAFWIKEGLDKYGNQYTLAGTVLSSGHGAGLASVNAMLAFGLPVDDAKRLLQAAWDAVPATGRYRYYDNCLYMLSLLYMSGKFSRFR